MGSWNGTCGISQLDIQAGDKVKLVIIQNNVEVPEASGFCYTTGISAPISFILSAEYNDYGSVCNIIDDLPARLFLDYFRDYLRSGKITIEPDKYYDNEKFPDGNINYEELNIEDVMKVIERDRVFKNKSFYNTETERMGTKKTNIGLLMFHEEILEDTYRSVLNSNDYELRKTTKENLVQDIDYFIDDYFIKEPKYGKSFNSSTLSDIRKVGDWSNSMSIFTGSENLNVIAFVTYINMIDQMENKAELRQELKDMFIPMNLLLKSMMNLRKSWCPQSGKGSQSENDEVHYSLAMSIIKKINNSKKELIGDWVETNRAFTLYGLDFEEYEELKVIAIDFDIEEYVLEKENEKRIKLNFEEFRNYIY
jgi:hypothetical protein